MSKKIALLATDGVEEVEFTKPRDALLKAGAEAVLVSPKDEILSTEGDIHPSESYPADLKLARARAEDFDGLVLPGGTVNSDTLRIDEDAVAFVRDFVASGKPIATICHGAWTLLEAGGVKGRTLTSWPSLKTDLVRAGATWVDEEYVRDGKLASSRNPKDLPAFCEGIVELFELA